ncbi:MAG: patatin-like phospholipase family protein [Xanthomonadales bacterium]|nr:patatin-like phospholipase family protein [Xanthomonadales bacterium]
MSAPGPHINLALQGGGAHGAFTWGVLDRLLEDPRIGFDAISATSSGALNALAMAQGWISGGREGARTCLDVLWQRIAGHPQAGAWIFGARQHVAASAAQNLHRYFSSRQIKPGVTNPVSQIAEVMFDFEQLRAESPFALHLAATRRAATPRPRRPAGLNLPAADLCPHLHRWRALLGWRLGRQSGTGTAACGRARPRDPLRAGADPQASRRADIARADRHAHG